MAHQENTTTTTQLSPSSIAFLYAHRFAGPGKSGKTGTRSLANESVVDTIELGRRLFTVALWSLQDMGAVSIESVTEHRGKWAVRAATLSNFTSFKFKRGAEFVTSIAVRLLEPREIGGIEGGVLEKLSRLKKARDPGCHIGSIIFGFEGDPEGAMVQRAIEEVVKLGYADIEDSGVGAIKHLVTHKSRHRIAGRMAEIEALKAAADDLVARYNAYFAEAGAIPEELARSVQAAFQSRRESYEERMRDSDDSYDSYDGGDW